MKKNLITTMLLSVNYKRKIRTVNGNDLELISFLKYRFMF